MLVMNRSLANEIQKYTDLVVFGGGWSCVFGRKYSELYSTNQEQASLVKLLVFYVVRKTKTNFVTSKM